MANSQKEISSGRRVSRPSDDPANFVRIEQIHHRLEAMDDFDNNASAATRRFQTADTALDQLFNTMVRTRELVIEGSNDTLSATNRTTIAEEMKVVRDQVFQLASTKVGRAYVFSGTNTDTPPLDATGAYQGGGSGAEAEVGDGTVVDLAIEGNKVFDGPFNIVAAMDGIINDLATNDPVSLRTRLDALDGVEDQILKTRTDLGARQTQVRIATDITDVTRFELSRDDSNLGDTDIADVASRLMHQEQALDAAVKVSTRAMRPSLLDYI